MNRALRATLMLVLLGNVGPVQAGAFDIRPTYRVGSKAEHWCAIARDTAANPMSTAEAKKITDDLCRKLIEEARKQPALGKTPAIDWRPGLPQSEDDLETLRLKVDELSERVEQLEIQ